MAKSGEKLTCRALAALFLLALLVLGTILAPQALATPMAKTRIRILGAGLYLDTRPDVEGLQSTMTAVKDISSAVSTIVGVNGVSSKPAFAEGTLVKAEITGPDFASCGPKTLTAAPNEKIDLPLFRIAGVYRLYNVRMTDPSGKVVLARDQSAEPIIITVIDQILVTQVTTRALTAAEIEARGIVVDEDNYTVKNFAVALTLGSKNVKVNLPVFIPKTYDKEVQTPSAASIPGLQAQLDAAGIPNLSLSGFQMQAPPDPEFEDLKLPAISGVIVIPGNIAYLNQFLSVFLQATNMAPTGSGLVLNNAAAKIALPAGDDKISGSGDDPLRLAETQSGTFDTLPLADSAGSNVMAPQATHQAEFLVEGVKEGSHELSFDLSGDLYVPQLSRTVAMSGKAAGLVQVKNPTFNIVLSHPKTVRKGENYSITATVTNTSKSPANYFQLALNTRSMSGCSPVSGETGVRTVSTIAAGESASFSFRLKALVTGEVGGTVFIADGGINGSFMLTTGVGDKGIPLSPDTLVLPNTVDALPKTPASLAEAAIRLLGQAYSVATAPEGSLPDGVERISKACVSDKAVFLAQAGLHCQFGETPEQAAFDLFADYLGADHARLSALYPNDPASYANAAKDLSAFDALRRTTDAGADFNAAAASIMAESLKTKPLSGLLLEWAEALASRPAQLSFGVAGTGAMLRLTNADGMATGRVSSDEIGASTLPFSALLALTPTDHVIFNASPDSSAYTFEFTAANAGELTLSLIVPSGNGMVSVAYPATAVSSGAYGKMAWSAASANTYIFQLDTDGDGSFDTTLSPLSVTPVTDPAPAILGVRQWGKGSVPHADSFETGDALGTLVGVLFSEEVDETAAKSLSSYGVSGIGLRDLAFQSDRRMVFITLKAPVGPFVARSLGVSGVADAAGKIMADALVPITPDPDLGPGATYSGQVVTSGGTPVSFATVEYIATVMVYDPILQDEVPTDVVVSTLTADLNGRVSLDFVLQNTAKDTNGIASTRFSLRAINPADGRECEVKNRVFYDGQKMQYNLILRGTGAIKGRLYDEAGLPVPGGDPGTPESLAIYAIHTSTQKTVTGWIDANGYYAFPRTFTGADSKKTEASSIEVGNVLLRVVRVSDQATALATVNLPSDGAVVSKDLVLVTGVANFSGRVLESDGQTGAAGVQVSVKSRIISTNYLTTGSYETGLVGVTFTDESGGFSFEGLPAGNLVVTALRKATGETVTRNAYVDPGGSISASLLLPGYGGQVSGCVKDSLGNPVPNAVVSSGYSLAKADASGCFTFTNMPLGPYTITARKLDGMAVGTATGTLYTKDDAPQVLVSIEATGTIRGTVRQADESTPVASQKVQLWINKGGEYLIGTTVTDTSGGYVFKDYPLGDYSVRAVTGNYGDGGMAFTSLTVAGDERSVNVNFRGMGQISGRVLQDVGNGSTTPVISDVVITRKVWRVVASAAYTNNYYLDFVLKLKENPDFSEAVDAALASVDFSLDPPVFFMLSSEPVLVKSDILDSSGAVTGGFCYTGPVTGGPFKVSAFGPFLSPTEVTGEIPRSTTAAGRQISVGDIVLSPSVGSVTGTVFMPDGVTPVGEGVAVTLKSLGSSGSVAGINLGQAAIPEQSVTTDENGVYSFPLVLKGSCDLVADTGVPYTPAAKIADIRTDSFEALNVRLSGRSAGVVPQGVLTPLVADIRLSGVAGLKVRVLDSNGDVVEGPASVSVTGFTRQYYYKSPNEIMEFFPVPEGAFSVSASFDGATGAVSGTVPKILGNAYPISIDVKLGSVTSGGTTTQVSSFGTVTGSISRADGSAVTSPCQVTVSSAGARIIGTSDSTGHYTIENAPGGYVTVSVLEPMTGRTGSGYGTISQSGQTVTVNVALLGAGEVTGAVMDGTGAVVTHPVDIVLIPSGDASRKILGRTDENGLYSLPGVPLGGYTVKATDTSGLSGSASGTLASDGDVNTTDIFLEPAGTISGVIYGPGVYFDTAGNPVDITGVSLVNPPRAAYATVTFTKGSVSESFTADASGNFSSSANLTMGTWKVTATLSGDGCTKNVTLNHGGETASLVMAMAGSGTVNGVVTNGDGAEVFLTSQSPYSTGVKQAIAGPGGAFTFANVNVGKFFITVRHALLSGAASGEITYHEEIVNLNGDNAVALQDAGTITGRVFLDDGITPAAGTRVQASNSVTLVAFADSQGCYTFSNIPRHTYNISFYHAATGGVGAVAANLDSGSLALASLTLDSALPTVFYTTPSSNAGDVNPGSAIAVNFSEPVNPATVNSNTFLVRENGVPVSGQVVVNPTDSTQVIFQPAAPFNDMAAISVTVKADRLGFEGQVLERGIGDMHGLGMKADYAFSFTTGDARPPSLVSVTPANGAIGVDTASVLRLTFSEPVTQASLNAALALSCVEGNAQVMGTLAPVTGFGGRVWAFAPSALQTDRTYRLDIASGVKDLVGNTMTSPVTSVFSTTDTLAPEISSLSTLNGASLVSGTTVPVTAEAFDSTIVSRVEFFVKDALMATDTGAPFVFGLNLLAEYGSEIDVSAIAYDAAGNKSGRFHITVPIHENQAPLVTISSPAIGDEVSQGEVVNVTVNVSDDVGATSVTLTAAGGSLFAQTFAISPASTSKSVVFSFTVPENWDRATPIVLNASATDGMGASADAGSVVLSVVDRLTPAVNIASPANNSRFEPDTPINLTVTASDASGVDNIEISVTGASADHTQWFNTEGGSPVSHSFTLTIPVGAAPTSPVNVSVTVTDGAGNAGVKTLVIWPADHVAPSAATVICYGGNNVEPASRRFVRVVADDNVGIAKIKVNVGDFFSETRQITPASHSQQDFYFTLPVDTLLGASIPVTATVWDASENALEATPISLTAADLTAPTVRITEPLTNSEVLPGSDVTVRVTASDNYGVSRLEFIAAGAAIGSDEINYSTPAPQAQEIFTFHVPVSAASNAVVILEVNAYDEAGRKGYHTIPVKIKDVVGPSVTALSPYNGQKNVEPDTAVSVIFSEAVLSSSINDTTISLAGADGRQLTGTYSMPNAAQALFTPNTALALGSPYTLTITQGVCDIKGNFMAAAVVASFTVRHPEPLPYDDNDDDGFSPSMGDTDDWDETVHPGMAQPGATCDISATKTSVISPNPTKYEYFGGVLSMSNRYVIVGEPLRVDGKGTAATGDDVWKCGGAHIFERSNGGLIHAGFFKKETPVTYDLMGYSVAIAEETAFVGIPYDDLVGRQAGQVTDAGAVWVIERDSNGVWQHTQTLNSPSPLSSKLFGSAVSIWCNRAVIAELGGGWVPGKVYIYEKQASGWVYTSIIELPKPFNYGGHGYYGSISMSGKRFVIAFNGWGGATGGAYIYEFTGGGWNLVETLVPENLRTSSVNYGKNVSLCGKSALISAEKETNSSLTPNDGSVYIYSCKNNENSWSLIKKFSETMYYSDRNFGYSISLYGDYVAVTCRDFNIYLYQEIDTNFTLFKKVNVGSSSDLVPYSVALNGEYLMTGMPESFNGYAYYYYGLVYGYRYYCN